MDVPNSRFPYEALKIVQEVADSHFIAFDLEFSGVAGRRPDKSRKLTLQEYYEDIKEAAEKYQILQVGLTIVREDVKTGRYIARPYNFNISPLTPLHERVFGRAWSYHSGGQYCLLY
jgi:poly(A)-specific ribonuclease